MKPTRTSRWLAITCLLVLACTLKANAQAPASPGFTRQGMLRHVTRSVLVPGWRQLASSCRELTNDVGGLIDKPAPETLERARKSWLKASIAAERMRCFQTPVIQRDSVSTFYYWQVLPARMQGLLASPGALGPAPFAELGASTKGLFALEYLLFEASAAQTNAAAPPPLCLEGLAGPNAANYRLYLQSLARELEQKASLAANDWANPDAPGPAHNFVNGGQESVNLLVNQLAAGVEYAAERHLHFVQILPGPITRQLYRVERHRSGSSLEGTLACLEGAKSIYLGEGGLGIRDAIKVVNPGLASRVTAQFEAAKSATRAIGIPLEQAVTERRAALETAYQQTRALEILIKVDIVSALGVTLTFSSNDGD